MPCPPEAHRHIYTCAHAGIHTLGSDSFSLSLFFFLQFDAVSQDFKITVIVVESYKYLQLLLDFSHMKYSLNQTFLEFMNALGIEVFSMNYYVNLLDLIKKILLKFLF